MRKCLLKVFAYCLALVSLSAVAAKADMMTLKQMVNIKTVETAQVSPDGHLTAYTLEVPRKVYKAKDGKVYSELHVVDKKGKSRRFITGKVNVTSIKWSHDGYFIYYLAKRNEDKFTAIYRIPVDGGESEKQVVAKSNILSFSLNHNHRKLVYLAKPAKGKLEDKLKEKGFKAKVYEEAAKNSIAYEVDLTNLKKEHKKINMNEHILSVKFHPQKDELLMRTTPTSLIDDSYTSSHYSIVKLSGKKIKQFKTEGKLGSANWSMDGKYVAMIGAENKHDPAAGRLMVGHVKTGKVFEAVKNYPGHVKAHVWISNDELAFLGHVGTQSEISVVNLESGTIKNKVTAGDVVFKSLLTDSEGQSLMGIGSSDKSPKEVYALYSNEPKKLTNSNPWLTKIEMPKQETITYKARDGVEIQGVLIYPVNYKKSRRYPLIMMVHGGPESHVSDEWLDRYSYPIKHAAGKGFAVFLPNYRGSTGRGIGFSKMGQADYAGAEFNDLVDAITHLSHIGLVDKKRVGITGGSYGGYASAWAATALSEHFAASVMFVGISNQLSKFGTTDIPKEMHNVHARNYPWEKWQWMLERSPIYHTDKAKTPILIMHGDKDTRVHPSQSMELYRYIKTRTDTPVRLVFYPGEPHGNKKTAAQLDYAMRLMRWMSFYLKGKSKGKKIPPYELNHQEELKQLDKAKK